MRKTYGSLLPGMKLSDLQGKLIVVEGTDGAGRTTQINLLKPWLEEMGHAVLDTGISRSSLAGEGIRRAKEGNNLGRVTQSLFYATDFVDRLENEIVPALRAGFVVLTDRYIYSLMARAIVRGMDGAWIRSIFGVALVPDAVFYLRLGIDDLIPRVIYSRGFDYWESGVDLFPGQDLYDSFRNYQTALLAEFDRLSVEYQFDTVDASGEPRAVFAQLKARVLEVLERDSRRAYISKLYDCPTTTPGPKIVPAHGAGSCAGARDSDSLVQTAAQHYQAGPNAYSLDRSSGNGHGEIHGK
jgi:dTMP kinase